VRKPETNAKKNVVAGLLCLVALGGAGVLGAAEWTGFEEYRNGVPNVMNPDLPVGKTETVATEQLWRVGGEDDEGGEMLGFVTDVLVDDDGLSYLLDSTLSVIQVYDAEGNHVRSIGGEGEGPGEFKMASNFLLLPNGNIGVVQMMPAKLVTLDRQGIPGSHFATGKSGGHMQMIQRARASAGAVVVGKITPNFQPDGVEVVHSLSIVDSDGEHLHTVIETSEVQQGGLSIGGPGNEFTRQFAVGRDGRIFVAQHYDQYAIEVFNTLGEPERVIRREYTSVKRSAAEIAAEEAQNAEMAERFSGSVEMIVEQFERDIGAMHPRVDGELWVRNSQGTRECPAGALGVFDVFDADGKYQRRVALQADYDDDRDAYILAGDRLYILKEARKRPASTASSGGGGMMMVVATRGGADDDEEDEEAVPPSVICYRLPAK